VISQENPHCFSADCNQEWNIEFLTSIFTKTFLQNEFKNRMKNILLDRELALIPETQGTRVFQICVIYMKCNGVSSSSDQKFKLKIPYVKMSNFQRSQILEAFQNIRILDWIYKKIEYDLVVDTRYPNRPILEDQHHELIKTIDEQLVEIRNRLSRIAKATGAEAEAETEKQLTADYKNDTMHPCPKLGCSGFVSGDGCLLCASNICSICWEEERNDHKCKPENMKSVLIMKSESKGCPKCKARIIKNGGCLHMYCISCKTHFDWITGKISHIEHANPEFIAENPDACIDGLTAEQHEMFNDNEDIRKPYYDIYLKFADEIAKRGMILARTNIDLRTKFILELITKEKFIQEIYYRWKLRKIYEEETRTLTGYRNQIHELFSTNVEKKRKYEKILTKTIETFEQIGNTYDVVPYSPYKTSNRKWEVKTVKEIDEILQRYN
jgi:hypothetical protein